MSDPSVDLQIARVFLALDAGRVVTISDDEDNPGWHSYSHRYTVRTDGAGGYRLTHWEQINDAASASTTCDEELDGDGLRWLLGRVSAEGLAGAGVELPTGRSERLTKHLLPGEGPPAVAAAAEAVGRRPGRRKAP